MLILHYELEHPAHKSRNEMLNGKSFDHSDGNTNSPDCTQLPGMGVVTQCKTTDEIAAQLVKLEQEQGRLR